MRIKIKCPTFTTDGTKVFIDGKSIDIPNINCTIKGDGPEIKAHTFVSYFRERLEKIFYQ